jgi:hypothetical protein
MVVSEAAVRLKLGYVGFSLAPELSCVFEVVVSAGALSVFVGGPVFVGLPVDESAV